MFLNGSGDFDALLFLLLTTASPQYWKSLTLTQRVPLGVRRRRHSPRGVGNDGRVVGLRRRNGRGHTQARANAVGSRKDPTVWPGGEPLSCYLELGLVTPAMC